MAIKIMQFASVYFLFFLFFSIFLFYSLDSKYRYISVLICNIAFFYSWTEKIEDYISLFFVILCTWISSLILDKKKSKLLLVVAIIGSIFPLLLFKYFDFVIQNINAICKHIGSEGQIESVDLISPIGISFFTFQAVGYLIDVYRGKREAEKNILIYASFVSFFSTITSGPIERSTNLLVQIKDNKHKLSFDTLQRGIILFLYGVFVKLVIVSRLGIVVDEIFENYTMYGGCILVIGAIAYTIQIYCDFSSYSLMAMGVAKLFGFDLMENFNTPYFAESIQDFWRRWHISLSTWFRDYVYISLGGNRCSKVRKNINLLITFLISGVWHGANWTFVVWGVLHGFYQIIGNITKAMREKIVGALGINEEHAMYHLYKKLVVFILVAFAWIFFRAESIGYALDYIKIIFSRPMIWQLFDGTRYELGLSFLQRDVLLVALGILILVDYKKYTTRNNIDEILVKQHMITRILCVVILFMITFVFGYYGPGFSSQDFIYFNF